MDGTSIPYMINMIFIIEVSIKWDGIATIMAHGIMDTIEITYPKTKMTNNVKKTPRVTQSY